MQEPVRPVSSVLARYQQQEKDKQEEQQTTGYKSRFRDREYGGVRGPIGQQFAASLLNKDNKEEEKKKLEKVWEIEALDKRKYLWQFFFVYIFFKPPLKHTLWFFIRFRSSYNEGVKPVFVMKLKKYPRITCTCMISLYSALTE